MIEVVVVNVRHSSYDILVDRTTPFGNRFPVEEYGRELAIQHFERWVDDRPLLVEKLLKKVLELDRPVVRLGCHCKPKPCHANVWARLLRERLGDS